jgi:hypothetical protein
MDQVSQGSPRTRRLWADNEQAIAEVAAACGVPLRVIARALGRRHKVVVEHLIASKAEAARVSARTRRAANGEAAREIDRRYRVANIEKARERTRRWRAANAELERLYRKKNAKRDRERIRRWNQENPERVRLNRRQWRARNNDKAREFTRRRHALRRAGRRAALQPLTPTQKDSRWGLFGHACAYCGARCVTLTVDHVLALTNGGLDEADNVAPACITCNSSKHTRLVEEWYCRQPFFTEARWRKIQRLCPTATGQATLPLPA